jgi:glycosyltransferase involved in cell wall biosynthesis
LTKQILKVLQIIQRPQLRGAEIFACQLSIQLLQQGIAADVVYLFEQENVLPFKLNFHSLGGNSRKRFWDFQAYRRLSDIIRNGDYDIVQANAGDTLKYAALSKMLFRWKAPLVYRNANKISDFLNTRMKYYLNRFFVNQVSHVISVSQLCLEDFAKTFEFPKDKINTIPIGINVASGGPLSDELTAIFENGPVLLNVGSFVPEKNHIGLLSIFNKILTRVPHARLVLVGKGKLENEIKDKASELGIMHKVYFLGNRTDVQTMMRVSQAFLLPSLIEGLPAVILEAQFNKLPVTAYDVGGISEVITNGETGWLVQKDDEDGFVRAVIESIQTNPAKIERIIERGRDQVLCDYDNVKIAERFLKIYSRVIQK